MISLQNDLDLSVIALLACPCCDDRPAVSLNDDHSLVCESCKRQFPIIGGIPRMVVESED